MVRRTGVALLAAAMGIAGPAVGQSTGMPSFNAPYRAFAEQEFGVTLSFPETDGIAIEGQYRFGARTWDIGFRGGFLDPDGPGDTRILLGAEFRNRVITHSQDFPLDGAVVLGVGAQLVEDFSRVIVPGGLSLGRRLDVEDSQVSIVPYAQPTLFLTAGNNQDTELNFALGFGADFRLSRAFDARLSFGLGDIEGVAISAVWVR
jgi:hypothetical protein